MSIMQEILSWTQELPEWQSDAVARLLAKQELSTEDYDDLYALLKLANGIPDPKNRSPAPLSADQIPSPIGKTTDIKLRSIKNLRNINAIAQDTCLTIGFPGMTVIYGDNGSGKSDYSRVLKRACRARDQSEPILPNANSLVVNSGNAEATFGIVVDGSDKEVVWMQGKEAPPELSSFAIFDSRCARAYLDAEDDFSYVPYGLEVFEGLAKICQHFKELLDKEHAQSAVDITALSHLQGDTAVGKLIGGLSAKTNITQIKELSALTPQELEQRDAIEKSLKENNPKEKAIQIRHKERRIAALTKNVTEKGRLVDLEAITKLKTLADSYRAAKNAASLAAMQFKEGENLLPGTGAEAWRELFEAARKFALESHPEKQFPNLGEDALCPLCQQPLDESGAKRLLHFEEFIQAEAEKMMQLRHRALYAEYKPFTEQVITLNCDDVTYAEIAAIDPQLEMDIKTFEFELAARQETVKDAIISHEWARLEQPLISPADRLQALTDKFNTEAQALEKASNEEARVALQKQFTELDARVKLNQVQDAVIAAVEKLIYQTKLQKCLFAVKTTAISRKASELAEQVVSRELAEALNREFRALGAGKLKVSLQSRANKGKALHKLKLELPQAPRPADILSEGEQRAIAIGAFLAEIGLRDGTGGIVFDDPVSSLDHRIRDRVAKRFVQEAEKRQVIIFTHDIYFLCTLAEAAKQAKIPINTQSLTRQQEGFGVAVPDLPFEGKNTKKRIIALKEQQQAIAKLYSDGNEQEHRKQTVDVYNHLRMSWERSIEEVLFREVILRFRKGVETQRLAGVSVGDDDYARVTAGMSKCSNYTHDRAMVGGIAVPDPEELLEDINALEEWRVQVQKRSEETAKNRKVRPLS